MTKDYIIKESDIPDSIRAAAAASIQDINPNREEARTQYERQTEDNKTIADNITNEIIKECIDAIKNSLPFLYIQDVYRIYCKKCIEKQLTPIYQKYFLIAANRAGYPTYYNNGKTCIWISDRPKSRPGKRKKRHL